MKGKKILSLVLSASIALSAFVGIAASGMFGAKAEINYTRLESDTFGSPNLYNDPAQAWNGMSGNVCTGGCKNGSMQTYSDIQANGLNSDVTPYVAYGLEAQTAGEYSFKIGYYVSDKKTDNQYYALYVKPAGGTARLYKTASITSKGYQAQEVKAYLDKGINTVYCIPFIYEGGAWQNFDYLDVQDTLTVRGERFGAHKAEFTNRFNNDRSKLCSVDSSIMISDGVTVEKRNTMTLDDVATSYSMAITVDAVTAGDYIAELRYNADGSSGDHYFGVFVGNENQSQKVKKHWASNGSSYYGELKLSLKKGTNVITISALLPNEAKGYWSDLFSLYVLGADVADRQINPVNNLIRYQVESYATLNRYSLNKDQDNRASGGYALGGCWGMLADRQSFEQLTASGAVTENDSYTQYTVNAPTAGKYTVNMCYYIELGTNTMDNRFFAIVANGVTYKGTQTKNPYPRSGEWYNVTAEVQLKKGTNSIYLVPFTNTDGVWHRVDYIELSPELYMVNNDSSVVELNAADSEFFRFYAISGTRLEGTMYNKETVTFEDGKLSLEDLIKFPHYSYTVTAPKSANYTIAAALCSGGDGRVGIFVDDKCYLADYTGNGWNDVTAEITVPISEGTHTISVTCNLKNQKIEWVNQAKLILYNGLKKADRQVSPFTGLAKMEAEGYAVVNKYNPTPETGNKYASGLAIIGGRWGTDTVQSYDDIQANGLDASKTPYITYTVNAPADGTYTVKPGYYVNKLYTGGYMALLVNNTDLYKVDFTSDGCSAVGYWNSNSADVTLKAGKNTVTLIGYLDNGDGSYWHTHDYLEIDSRLTAVKPDSMTRLEAETYGIVNRYSDKKQYNKPYSGEYCVGGCWSSTIQAFDTLEAYGINKNKTAYVAYKLEAPESGTYKIKLGYYVNSTTEAEQFFAVVVNGRVYKSVFEYVPTDKHWNIGTLDIQLEAGRNTVYCIPYVGDGTTGNHWHNQDYLDIDPRLTAVEPTGFTRLEAECYGEYYNYREFENNAGLYSGGIGVAMGVYNQDIMLSEEQLKTGVDENNPYVYYAVNVASNGLYTLRVGYTFGSDNIISDTVHPYIYIFVNGKGYRVESTTDEIDVELQAGRNDVYCGVYSKELYEACGSSAWVNHDYLDIGDGITGIMPEVLTDAAEGFTRYEAESDALKSGLANFGSDFLSGKKGIKLKNGDYVQTKDDILANGVNPNRTAFAQYDVYADADGDYDVKLGFRYNHIGKQYPNSGRFYIIVTVNDTPYVYDFTTDNNRQHALSVEDAFTLKAGKNVVKVITPTGDSLAEDLLSYIDIYHDYIDVANEATVGALTRLEAEDCAYNYYSVTDRAGSSGGKAATSPWVSQITSKQMTFAKVNHKNIRTIPSVYYKVVAEKAGTYTVSFGICAGRDENITSDAFFAVIVNENTPQKAQYLISDPSSCTLEVQLNEGKNTIAVTASLFDLCELTDPINEAYTMHWVDHDYIDLPAGVTADNTVFPIGEGDELADLDDPLLVGRPYTAPETKTDGTGKSPSTFDRIVYALPYILALGVLSGITVCCVSRKARRKRSNAQ